MYSNKNKKSNYKERGFTLIEVLIAMAIFSIGILGVGSMQLKSTTGNTSARIRTEASIWAQDRVETLMLLSYGSTDLNPANNPHSANEGLYTVEWNVWDTAGGPIAGAVTQFLNGITPATNTKIIEVTVTGRGNRSSTVVFAMTQNV
ncbi:MAG: type IV pilus modification PilV family protein [Methanosarcinaceae archaeon]